MSDHFDIMDQEDLRDAIKKLAQYSGQLKRIKLPPQKMKLEEEKWQQLIAALSSVFGEEDRAMMDRKLDDAISKGLIC